MVQINAKWDIYTSTLLPTLRKVAEIEIEFLDKFIYMMESELIE